MRHSFTTLIVWLLFVTSQAQNSGVIDRTYAVNGYSQFSIGANTDDRLIDTRNSGTGKLYFLANDLSLGRLDSTGKQDVDFGVQQIIDPTGAYYSFGVKFVKYIDVVPDATDTSIIVVILDGTKTITLRKFNNHGAYDPSFGTNGVASFTSVKPVYQLGKALFQPDGKIVLDMGSSPSPYNDSADIIVARLLPNGSPDNSFGTNGITVIDQTFSFCKSGDVCMSTRDFVGDMTFTPDGKIIVVSSLEGSVAYDYSCVFRLNANGTIDKSFADNGHFYVYIAGWEILPKGIRTSGSNFYICFNQVNYLDNISRSNVVRYSSDGRLDTTFKSLYMPVLPGYSVGKILGFQLQKDKKVNVLCTTGHEWGSKPYVVRLKRNGNFDSTFGNNSIAVIDTLTLLPAADIVQDPLSSLEQDTRGRLTLGTSVKPPDHYDLLFTRLNIGEMLGLNPPAPNAGPDQTFCAGTSITVGTPGTDDFDYSWNFVGNNSTPIFTVPMPTFQDFATSDLVLKVTNAVGVSANDTVHLTALTAPTRPVISAGYPYFCIGSSLALTSSSASNYQWYKDGVIIPAATAQVYNAVQSGKYTVQVSNGTCTSTSLPLDVTASPLPAPPTLSASGSLILCNGSTVTLTSSASFGNRWYVNGVVNPSQGRPTWVVSQGGTYTTTATVNGCESATSNAIVITAGTGTPPSITASGPLSFCAGSSVTLTSSSTSGNQWYKDNIAISGATSQTYVANQTGNYTVTVANGSCSFTSSAVAVNALSQASTPAITASAATTICAGNNVLLTSSSVSGNQWYKDGTLISGATSQTYSASQAGAYTVIVGSGSCASAPSSPMNVTVTALPSAPVITYSGTTNLCNGATLVLTSSAASGNQWFKDGVSIAGATATTFSATQAGIYTVKTTSGSCTSPPSSGVTIAITTVQTPVITAAGNTSICEGSNAVLTSSLSTGNQWYKDGVAISNATASTYSVTQSGTYTAKVTTGSCTSSLSNGISVVVNAIPPKPVITQSGNTLSSSSSAGNQWYKDGAAIQGATATSYTPSQAGQYTVVVTLNGCSSPSSAAISFVVTAINSPSFDNKIQIIPNPVHDVLSIKYNGNPAVFKMQLVDVDGSKLREKTFTNSTTINVQNIAGGIYIVHIINLRNGDHLQQMIMKL